MRQGHEAAGRSASMQEAERDERWCSTHCLLFLQPGAPAVGRCCLYLESSYLIQKIPPWHTLSLDASMILDYVKVIIE